MGSSQSTPTVPKWVPPEATGQPENKDAGPFPVPTGNEYDPIDKIAAELPSVIDDESRQQVEDYRQACDNGKGPMVRRRWRVASVITVLDLDFSFVKALYSLTPLSPIPSFALFRLRALPRANIFLCLNASTKKQLNSIAIFAFVLPTTNRLMENLLTGPWHIPRVASTSPKCS